MKRILLSSLLLVFTACGTDKVVEQQTPKPSPGPGPGPSPTPGTTWAEMERLHSEYCIQCHANSGFIRNESALKSSSAKQRVQNGSMPPPNGRFMSPSERELYLNFFSG